MFPAIQLDRSAHTPLQDQLFNQMREMIVSSKLKTASRIIPTRFMAEYCGVSRTTVLLAYERLISECYLETRPDIGTFVCSQLPEEFNKKHNENPNKEQNIKRQALSHPSIFSGKALPKQSQLSYRFDFCKSFPDKTLLPTRNWLRTTQRVFEEHHGEFADVPSPIGIEPLRRAISDWLAARRGITVSPEQVIITAGNRQAYSLITHLFQKKGDCVVVESPCNLEMVSFFESRKAALLPVRVDEKGIVTDELPNSPVSIAYVTPARQNPTGFTMSQKRREKLIAWAREVGAYIIEDDCDGEFRYRGTSPLPLAALDTYGLVFHIGSFSKTMGAGFCMSYLLVPQEFVGTISAIKSMSDDGYPWLQQRVMADFIVSGEYDHHLRRLRKTFLVRNQALVKALQDNFGDVQLIGGDSGSEITWLVPDNFPPPQELRKLANIKNIDFQTIKDGNYVRAIIFRYGGLNEEQLREGIKNLAGVLKNKPTA